MTKSGKSAIFKTNPKGGKMVEGIIIPEEKKKQLIANYKKSLSILRENTENIREMITKINKRNPQSLEIWQLRTKLIKFFLKKEFRQLCSTCQGSCCSSEVYKSMRLEELFYFLSLPTSVQRFDWPEPDWQFLQSKIEQRKYRDFKDDSYQSYLYLPKCLFASPQGCLLGQWRPWVCLIYTCDQMRNIMDMNKRKRKYFAVLAEQSKQRLIMLRNELISELVGRVWSSEKLLAWFRRFIIDAY